MNFDHLLILLQNSLCHLAFIDIFCGKIPRRCLASSCSDLAEASSVRFFPRLVLASGEILRPSILPARVNKFTRSRPFILFICRGGESNTRRLPLQGSALPLSYHGN